MRNAKKNRDVPPMRKSPKKAGVFLNFDEALDYARNRQGPCDLSKEFFSDDPQYRTCLKDFIEKHRDDLEELYVRHKVPPSVILDQIGMCQFSDVPAMAPPLLRSRRLQQESAARMDQVADDVDLWARFAGPLHGVPSRLGSGAEFSSESFSRELRDGAAAIRARTMNGRPASHRPRNVMLIERALYLTDLFLEHAGKPLWGYTASLIDIAGGADRVKKTVLAAIKRNLHGSIEKKIERMLKD